MEASCYTGINPYPAEAEDNTLHEEYRAFFRLFGTVARYGCDFSATDAEPDEFQRPLGIGHDEFLAEIYEPRGVEQKIIESLRSNPNLVCLVGGPGAGKSSVAYKVRQDLKTTSPSTFAVFLDLRLEIANNAVDTTSRETLETTLRRRLIAEYRERLFPLTRSGDNPRVRLWSYLLDRLEESLKPLHLFANFASLQDRAARYLRRHDAAHKKETPIGLFEWLNETYASHDDVSKLTEDADALIDFSHLAYAARFLLDKEQQIIWLDNIDALPDELQTEAVYAVKHIYLPVQKYVGMLVAVREENIFRDYDLCDEGAPPYESRILLEMPRNGDNYAYYPAHDVPVASDSVLKGITKRRLQATRKYQAKRIAEVNDEIRALGGTTAPERLDRLKRELDALSPAIAPIRYAQVETAAERLLRAMSDERAIYFTNNSLRDYLFLFRDCLSDMFREPDDTLGRAPGARYPEWYVATMVLRRARHTARRYQIGVYDVIASTDEYYRGDATSVGCLLPYLIITTTWNLTLRNQTSENRYGHTPAVRDVQAALERLGFASEEIRAAMHALYFRNNLRQNLIEFRTRGIIRTAEEIRPEHVMYVTYRGKCMVSRTGSSFGYLYDCVALLTGSPDEDYVGTLPAIKSTEDAAEEMLPYLCDMADMHYRALRAIRDRKVFGDGDWLGRYYALHGTPHIDPYARNYNGGRVVGGRRRTLLLEGILNSLLGYVRVGTAHDNLMRLLNTYVASINSLLVDDAPMEPSFRHMVGVPARKVAKAYAAGPE